MVIMSLEGNRGLDWTFFTQETDTTWYLISSLSKRFSIRYIGLVSDMFRSDSKVSEMI